MSRQINPNSVNPFTALPNALFGILEGYEFCVLLALRYHGCECYPSQKRLGELAGISVRTVQRTLESLKVKRLVSWVPREDERGQTTNLYTLHIDELWAPTPRPTVVPPTTASRAPHAPEAYKQDLPEQDLLEPEERNPPPPLTLVRGGVKKPTKKELLYQAVLEIYNQNKPENWPKKRGITGDTKELLDKKFKQLGVPELEFVEMLANALHRCKAAPFPRDNYTLNTLFRSTHLTDLSEAHVSSRPVSNSKGYNNRADRTAATRQEFLDRFSGLEKPSQPSQPSFTELFGNDDDT